MKLPAGAMRCPHCAEVGNPWQLSRTGHRFWLRGAIRRCPISTLMRLLAGMGT